jgi:hypothetical protein
MNTDQLYYDEFVTDLITEIAWAKENIQYSKIGVHSFSMGSIITHLAFQRVKIDFAIYDSPAIDPLNIAKGISMLKDKVISTPISANTFQANFKSVNRPILTFYGKKDILNDFQNIELLNNFDLNQRIEYTEAAHLGNIEFLSYEEYGDRYIQMCHEFIEKIL